MPKIVDVNYSMIKWKIFIWKLLSRLIMNKQTTFALTAIILLIGIASVWICTLAANGQSNSTGGTGSNLTKSNMTSATSNAAKNMTVAGGIKSQGHLGGGKPAG
jgi:hypothetical protein